MEVIVRAERLMLVVLLTVACGGGTASDDDVVPATPVAGQPEIPYPPELFERQIEGEVLLYVVVDSAGIVLRDSTRIARSSGQSAFDAAAMAAAPALKFQPARRSGVAIMYPIQVPIRFTLPDTTRSIKDSP